MTDQAKCEGCSHPTTLQCKKCQKKCCEHCIKNTCTCGANRCEDCSDYEGCDGCDVALCANCLQSDCRCGKTVCRSCSDAGAHCKTCGQYICDFCLTPEKLCSKCVAPLVACTICYKNCTSNCEECGPVCRSHIKNCDSCLSDGCERCVVATCGRCTRSMCSQCSVGVAKGCIHTFPRCSSCRIDCKVCTACPCGWGKGDLVCDSGLGVCCSGCIRPQCRCGRIMCFACNDGEQVCPHLHQQLCRPGCTGISPCRDCVSPAPCEDCGRKAALRDMDMCCGCFGVFCSECMGVLCDIADYCLECSAY